jgi:SAM-dependent methyltransferase
METLGCPLGCAPADQLMIEAGDRLGGQPGRYRMVKCHACGLMRTNPRPTPESMGTYYAEDYGPYAVRSATDLASWKARLTRSLGLDSRRLPPVRPGRMLELGCASGGYLREAALLGWDVEGIEFSESAAANARAAGLRVQVCTVEQAKAPSAPYDLVVAWMVLEHLHEPVAALRRLRDWTAADGYFVCSVPDAAAWERRLFGDAWYALQLPTHLHHFTPATIRRLMRAAGWVVVRIRWQPNSNNLLMSLAYKFEDWRWPGIAKATRAFAQSPRTSLPRLALGWLLALLRQSGRMEVWARPISAPAPSATGQ